MDVRRFKAFPGAEDGVADLLELITPLKHERYVIGLWRRTQHKIGRWMQGQFLLAITVAILVYVSLSFFGVHNALFLALISMFFEIIPVFGAFIGAIPGILLGFTQGGVSLGLTITVVYIVIQQIESNVIYPLVVRKIFNVSPLVVIIALAVGWQVGGFLGILLSVPVAVALTEYMGDVGKRRSEVRAQMSETVI